MKCLQKWNRNILCVYVCIYICIYIYIYLFIYKIWVSIQWAQRICSVIFSFLHHEGMRTSFWNIGSCYQNTSQWKIAHIYIYIYIYIYTYIYICVCVCVCVCVCDTSLCVILKTGNIQFYPRNTSIPTSLTFDTPIFLCRWRSDPNIYLSNHKSISGSEFRGEQMECGLKKLYWRLD